MRVIYIVLIFLSGCTAPPIKTQIINSKLEGYYETAPLIVKSPLSYEAFWDKLVDHFVQTGLNFTLIDKSSGIILGGKTRIETPLFCEEINAAPKNPDAFVVSSKCQWKEGSRSKEKLPDFIEAEWNVRIKKVGDSVSLNVNLVNIRPQFLAPNTNSYLSVPTYNTAYGTYSAMTGDAIGCTVEVKSTGVFERSTAELFLK